MKPSPALVWGTATLMVTIVSCCSLIGVSIMPLISGPSYKSSITLFTGLAVGSLLGSAIFSLIPSAFSLHLQTDKTYLWKSLIIFFGIYLFYCSERIMRIYFDRKARKRLQEEQNFHLKTSTNSGSNSKDCDNSDDNKELQTNINDKGDVPNNNSSAIDKIAPVAWMIIIGDGLHNFIDGLSIGAAFSESIYLGMSTSIAVIFEEFPHELGDFAVLISSGMTVRQALGFNFLSACTCYIGMVLGILLGDMAQSASYIFALAAGMFFYISLVDMMGELSATLEECKHSTKESTNLLLMQNIGILSGIMIIFILAYRG